MTFPCASRRVRARWFLANAITDSSEMPEHFTSPILFSFGSVANLITDASVKFKQHPRSIYRMRLQECTSFFTDSSVIFVQ